MNAIIFYAIMLIENFNNFRFFNNSFSTSVYNIKTIERTFIFNIHFLRIEFFDIHNLVFGDESISYRVFKNFQKIVFMTVLNKSQRNDFSLKTFDNVTRHNDKSENTATVK